MTRRALAADYFLPLGVDDLHREGHLLFLFHLRFLVCSFLPFFHLLPPCQNSFSQILGKYLQNVLSPGSREDVKFRHEMIKHCSH